MVAEIFLSRQTNGAVQRSLRMESDKKRAEILQSTKTSFITKIKLKIVYKITCVQKQSSRGFLQDACSENMKQTQKLLT